MDILKLYHGSERIIESPLPNKGNVNNDFGQGLYCTEHEDLAKEWACKSGKNGFVNSYELDLEGLKILDLTKHTIFEWLALLLKNRNVRLTFPVAKQSRDWLIENYLIDTSEYDVIKGYRADDSYFSFVRDFTNNIISIDTLSLAMKLGELGEQYLIKSDKAFYNLNFVEAKAVEKERYYEKVLNRDRAAREKYYQLAANQSEREKRILDIIRESKKS